MTTTIVGVISADGKNTIGQGFTVKKSGEGTYIIAFTNAFSSIPVVIAVMHGSKQWPTQGKVKGAGDTKIQATVVTGDMNGNNADGEFGFIAQG